MLHLHCVGPSVTFSSLMYSCFRPAIVLCMNSHCNHSLNFVLEKQSLRAIYINHWKLHKAGHCAYYWTTIPCLFLWSKLCNFRRTRLHWGGLSNHLPSWIHPGKLQHPHYRWCYLWDWQDFLPYTGDPPTSSGHWCHERWPIHGYRHHYKWWWWVFCNIIPTHRHIQCSQLPTVAPRLSCSVSYIYFVSWLTAQAYCDSHACRNYVNLQKLSVCAVLR